MAKNIKNKVRIPPQSKEAEQAVLGCMLIEKQAASKALQTLISESFYNIENSK